MNYLYLLPFIGLMCLGLYLGRKEKDVWLFLGILVSVFTFLISFAFFLYGLHLIIPNL